MLIRESRNEYETIFLSNLLPVLNKKDYEQLSFDKFIDLRSEEIHKRLKILCNGIIF